MPAKFTLAMLEFQSFLLDRNRAGPMGDVVLVITTTCRKRATS